MASFAHESFECSVQVDGVRVHYCRSGRGPALVMVHGLVGSAKNWEQNIEQLAQVRTVFALDLANMGESDRVAGLDASLEATADRLARAMDELGLDAADIAGHSHGGAIALMLAARHPDKVRKLVLFAPANPYCDLGKGLIGFYNSRPGSWFARQIPSMPMIFKRFAHSRMYVDRSCATERALEGYVQSLDPEAVEHVLRIVGRWWVDMAALRKCLDGLAELPVLLIWGDRDIAVGLQSGELLAEQLHARLLVLPGVGHLPFAERPDLCNQVVGDWLAA